QIMSQLMCNRDCCYFSPPKATGRGIHLPGPDAVLIFTRTVFGGFTKHPRRATSHHRTVNVHVVDNEEVDSVVFNPETFGETPELGNVGRLVEWLRRILRGGLGYCNGPVLYPSDSQTYLRIYVTEP